MEVQHEISIVQWLEKLQAKGVYGFSVELLKQENPHYGNTAVKRALSRLSSKGKVLSVFKGYYLILPPQYATKGILPPHLYLDALMHYLQRPYYVSLLNAAAMHGAAHQQPQEYFVTTVFPVLRATHKRGQKVNFLSIHDFPQALIDKRKTEAGYLNFSNAVLTTTDLVQFEKRIGGLNRAAAVLVELVESINPGDFNPILLQHVPVTALQRLGYLLENVCHAKSLADALFEEMQLARLKLFRIPLKASESPKGHAAGNRWKVIVNVIIEIDG